MAHYTTRQGARPIDTLEAPNSTSPNLYLLYPHVIWHSQTLTRMHACMYIQTDIGKRNSVVSQEAGPFETHSVPLLTLIFSWCLDGRDGGDSDLADVRREQVRREATARQVPRWERATRVAFCRGMHLYLFLSFSDGTPRPQQHPLACQ